MSSKGFFSPNPLFTQLPLFLLLVSDKMRPNFVTTAADAAAVDVDVVDDVDDVDDVVGDNNLSSN